MQNLYQTGWFFKYKLHHLLFWAVYHFLWWVAYEGSATRMIDILMYPPVLIKYLSYVIYQAIGVYFCLYYLIPKFLPKGQYVIFLGALTATILAMAGLIYSGYHIAAYAADRDVSEFFNLGLKPVTHLFTANALPSCVASMTLGMSIKLSKNWIESQQRQQELEKEKLETELKFLKSQFNPHFLFNTINSIFVLINKNKDLATDSLAKFSSLLRYQLYECNENKIPLNRELAYLESFIELEKLRLNDNFEVKTHLLHDYRGSLSIAPFVLMPFIENAFKHVSQNSDQVNWIKIDLNLEDDQLTFSVANSTSVDNSTSRDAIDFGGLGLSNVKRRLDLIYPDAHGLEIASKNGMYKILLTINLTHEPSSVVLIDA